MSTKNISGASEDDFIRCELIIRKDQNNMEIQKIITNTIKDVINLCLTEQYKYNCLPEIIETTFIISDSDPVPYIRDLKFSKNSISQIEEHCVSAVNSILNSIFKED